MKKLTAMFIKRRTLLLGILFMGMELSEGAEKDDTCSFFYPETGNSVFQLTTNQYISNMEDAFQPTVDNGTWVPIHTFSIKSGCSVTACNDTDFGFCKQFDGTANLTQMLRPADYQDILSASCTCSKECRCTDHVIKRGGCARAYIKKGCNECQSYYMDMKPGEKAVLPDTIPANVKSIVVRPSCTLVVYPEEDFEGVETILEGITREDWPTDIPVASYQCECVETGNETVIRKPRPPHYPDMIELPSNVDGVSALSMSVGRHPGVMASLTSYKSKRSTKNAYILLLGLTGSGKSTAINLLFDRPNLTKVGDGPSTTTDIHEFRIPIEVDELGIANAELRVIDTPGLGDTRGMEQDARFLATLDEYLANHEELSHRLPNVVLIFGKFDDNRFRGKGSVFVKMLNALDTLRDRITDKTYSNVIFVLSHYMSTLKEVTRRPAARIKQFKEVIEEFSVFPKPISIVVAENKGDKQDLLMLNGFYQLPNGEFYPRNLFDKIQRLTMFGGDPIGEAVIRTAFKDSSRFNISVTNFSLVEKRHRKSLDYFNILLGSVFPVENTEISQLLAQAELSMPQVLKTKHPESLIYIQRAFNLRKIHVKRDLPTTKLEIIKFLKDIKQSETTNWLMEKALGLKPPVFDENVIVGNSYNVLEDRALPASPLEKGALQTSDIGYLFPSTISCELNGESVERFRTFPTRAAYIDSRLKDLGVGGKVPETQFKGEMTPGNNLLTADGKPGNSTLLTLSGVREYRNFKLTLNRQFKVTPAFSAAVLSLSPFNKSSLAVVNAWNDFFATYGTHVVESVHGGGSIQISITSSQGLNMESAQELFSLIQFAEDISIARAGNETRDFGFRNGTTHALQFRGGDMKYHAEDLRRMSLAGASDLMDNWKESIKLSPAILTSELKLLPISHIAKKVPGQNISSEIDRAVSILFDSQIIYVPVSQGTGRSPPPVRDDTEHLPTKSSSAADFQGFLAILLESQQKSDAKFQEMMKQMQEMQMNQENKRAEEVKEQLRWDREQARLREESRNADRKQEMEQERQRIKEEKEYRERRDEERARDERQRRADEAKLQAAMNQRQIEMISTMSNRPAPSGSCLMAGTPVALPGGGSKAVENFAVGEFVLGGDLQPVKVLGVSYEFLMTQSFYGFGNTEPFFTDSHLFVGRDSKLYAKSTEAVAHNNPLITYLGVEEMGDGFEVMQLSTTRDQVVGTYRNVSQTTESFPPETKVYFLQVDSDEGTFFANGYMTRHEVPPFELWPRTMPILFSLIPEAAQTVQGLPYTFENIELIHTVIAAVQERVETLLAEFDQGQAADEDVKVSSEEPRPKEAEEREMSSHIYGHPSVSALAVGIYGSSGSLIAKYIEEKDWEEGLVKLFQKQMRSVISSELRKYTRN